MSKQMKNLIEEVKANYEQKEFLDKIAQNIKNGDNAVNAVIRAGGQMRVDGFNKAQLIDWFCAQIKTSQES